MNRPEKPFEGHVIWGAETGIYLVLLYCRSKYGRYQNITGVRVAETMFDDKTIYRYKYSCPTYCNKGRGSPFPPPSAFFHFPTKACFGCVISNVSCRQRPGPTRCLFIRMVP